MPNLPKAIFGIAKINTQAIFDTILSERASRRQGTHKTKERDEVSGGGKKPWKQKGTGRARAGSTRSPIWVGGGVVFGPRTERNYNLKVNKKVRKLAMSSSLTLLAKNDAIIINDFKIDKISTKLFIEQMKLLNFKKDVRNILIVTEDLNTFKSAANVQKVQVQKINSLSVEALAHADVVVMSEAHVARLVEVIK